MLSMATAVIMPRQGQSVESCIIGKWHKQKGDKVQVGDILFAYETDKATFEEDAKTDGILLDVFYEEGDEVECLKVVCVIGNEGESVEEFRDAPNVQQAPSNDMPPVSAAAETAVTSRESAPAFNISSSEVAPIGVAASDVHGLRISPRARTLAAKTGADLSKAIPTGANNRIIESDVQKVIAAGHLFTSSVDGAGSGIIGTGIGGRVRTQDLISSVPAASVKARLSSAGTPIVPDCEQIKLSNVRKFIARAMHSSLSDSAQLTHHSSFDATDVMAFRKNLKSVENHPELSRITVTDILIYATSRVLLKHKSLNAYFNGDNMTIFNNVHMGLAVDAPRGLLVPTIFNANVLSLSEISVHSKALADKARNGTLAPDEQKGGTFTISNIGSFGVEMFTPVLNPPQTGILGVCNIIERTRNGKFYPAMGLSLTYDHRAADGADAGRFQKELIEYLENFSFNIVLDPVGLF